jgi:hypothetical protein
MRKPMSCIFGLVRCTKVGQNSTGQSQWVPSSVRGAVSPNTHSVDSPLTRTLNYTFRFRGNNEWVNQSRWRTHIGFLIRWQTLSTSAPSSSPTA